MKVSLLAKVVAVLVFAFGAITSVNTYLDNPKNEAKSFVVTYLVTRSENGKMPITIGLSVKAVSTDGEWQQTKVRMAEQGHREQVVSTRFVDKTAVYKLEGSTLSYVGAAEPEFQRDRNARAKEWVTTSGLFVREDSMLGLKVYITHQNLNDGWVEQAFSPVTRATPLLYREHVGEVETIEKAVSVQFRDVSIDEIKPPNLPISFEWAKWLEQAMLSNPENIDTVSRLIADREAVMGKLRALGRIE